MKIAILTHPLISNYGGILQNYALQQVLKDLGHAPETLDYRFDISLKVKIKRFLKSFVGFVLGKSSRFRYSPTLQEDAIIRREIIRFVNRYISTKNIKRLNELNSNTIRKYDAIIVGSDQVWRAPMVRNVKYFFLSGITNCNIKKIAYAASFGVDNWEYSDSQTRNCKLLAKRFDKITCRERSGVLLCNKFLDVDASFVLDPTMLLKKERYIQIVNNSNVKPTERTLFVYILDMNQEKHRLITQVSNMLHLEINQIKPPKEYRNTRQSEIEECVIPSIESWLSGFNEADFVITDSFHGTAFSIIFEKQFLTIGNEYRGNSRFDSLLQTFCLQNRLIDSSSDIKSIVGSQIDYSNVSAIRDRLICESINILKKTLA